MIELITQSITQVAAIRACENKSGRYQCFYNSFNPVGWSVGFCRGSRVEGNMSRVEVEGKKKCFFVWSISISSRFSHILGFHLTSGLKSLSFHLHQVKVSFNQNNICWPVFSLVGYFVLNFSTMRDVRDVGIVSGLGNLLRARKYLLLALCARKCRFALCFRVLSNLYVERSVYANVF